jgi:glucokinase
MVAAPRDAPVCTQRRPRVNGDRVIGVDVGGTKILAGVLERDGTILLQREVPTPTDSHEALVDALVEAVTALPQDGVAGVAYGLPTRLDQATGRTLGSVNIPLRPFPFRDTMQERLGLPVEVDNDANLAALAEWRLGAGRGTRNMLMITLGTGVGGGVVLDGALYRGWAELGHVVVVADGEPCQGACSGRGHVEAYCSGTAAGKIAKRVLGPNADAHDLVEQAHPALGEIGHYLGIAIGSLVNIFGSTRVVIGGGFGIAAFDHLVPAARLAVLREALAPGGQALEIVRAELGGNAGLIGAALVAFEGI